MYTSTGNLNLIAMRVHYILCVYHWKNNDFVTYLNLGENSLHPMYRIVGDMMICLRLELSGRDFSVNAMDCGSSMLPPPIWSPKQQKHTCF